ncbi:hypothetical protein JCM18897A_26630 [Streptomyces sp. JCM 18897]
MRKKVSPWRKPRPVHEPGKVLLDVAPAVALGGDCLADVTVLRAESAAFGPAASDPTASRLIDNLAASGGKALQATRSTASTPSVRFPWVTLSGLRLAWSRALPLMVLRVRYWAVPQADAPEARLQQLLTAKAPAASASPASIEAGSMGRRYHRAGKCGEGRQDGRSGFEGEQGQVTAPGQTSTATAEGWQIHSPSRYEMARRHI